MIFLFTNILAYLEYEIIWNDWNETDFLHLIKLSKRGLLLLLLLSPLKAYCIIFKCLIRLVQKIVISLWKVYLPWLVSEWFGRKQYFIGHHIHSCDLLQWVHRRSSCFNNWTYLTSSLNLHRLFFSNIWGKIISLLFHSRNPMGVI